jgi:hypothetical protein
MVPIAAPNLMEKCANRRDKGQSKNAGLQATHVTVMKKRWQFFFAKKMDEVLIRVTLRQFIGKIGTYLEI